MKNIFLSLAFVLLIFSCGKPKDAKDISGGYEIITRTNTQGSSNDLLIDGNLCYITQGEAGLSIYNIENPEAPNLIHNMDYDIRGYAGNISKKNQTVYIAANNFGVDVIDVTDPQNPQSTNASLHIKPAKNFYIMDDFLITSISERGFNITYLENPLYPDIRGSNDTDGYAKDVVVSSDKTKLFVATGEVGLSVFDISTFDDGYGIYPKTTSINLDGYAEDIVILEDKSILFVACGNAGIQVLDYSNINEIKVKTQIKTAGYANKMVFKNNKLYLAAKKGGVQIIDVSNVYKPEIIGMVDTENATSLIVKDEYIYVADKNEGLLIISNK